MGEGLDSEKRETFTSQQLIQGYKKAFDTRSNVKLLMPILGETGCRLGEIVRLRKEDVCLATNTLTITPNDNRRLKTKSSARVIPLVGYAHEALAIFIQRSIGNFVFAQYNTEKEGTSTHASNVVRNWLKKV